MGLRICEECKKREMVRKDNPNPLCIACRSRATTKRINREKREKELCIRCRGKRDSEFLTCNKCRERYNKMRRERINGER